MTDDDFRTTGLDVNNTDDNNDIDDDDEECRVCRGPAEQGYAIVLIMLVEVIFHL
jgi:hypothetical protein